MSKLHIVFGTGPVGLAVVDELVRRGKTVKAVNRSGKVSIPAGIEMAAGDASDPAQTRALCQGATHVYNCTNAPYAQWPELFPRQQAGVLAGAAASGAKLIVMENVYLYGPTGGKTLTEDLPFNATYTKGVTRAQMAQDLLDAHRRGNVRATSGRASDFFGPRVLDSAVGDRVFARALAGKAAQVMGNPGLPHTYTYIHDIGQALVILGERDEALGRAWHIPSPRTVTTREFVNLVFQAAGQPPKIQPAGKTMLRLMGLFMPLMRELLKTYYQFDEPFIMDASAFEQTFGLAATPLEDAIRATVQWYRDHPMKA